MCKEVTKFIEGFSHEDPDVARAHLMEIMRMNPTILEQHKGESLWRVVQEHLERGEQPPHPTLLASTDKALSPWEVTNGFLTALGVATIGDIPSARVLGRLSASVLLENIDRPGQLTIEELGFKNEHFKLPGVRVTFIPVPVEIPEIQPADVVTSATV